MKRTSLSIVLASLILGSCSVQNNTKESNSELHSGMDTVSYSLGVSIANNLKRQEFDSLNVDAFARAVREVMNDDSTEISVGESQKQIRSYLQAERQQKDSDNLKKGKRFLAKNKKQEGVKVTERGLQYKVLEEGSGPKPSKDDKVEVHYHGTLLNGDVFDSSVDRGKPASFPVGGVIKGWQEALQMMKEGAKWKLWIPSELAYGERGTSGKIGPNETLIFEVELLDVKGKGEEK